MATLFSSPPSSTWVPIKIQNSYQKLPSFPISHYPFSISSLKPRKLCFSLQDERERETSSVAVVDENTKNEDTQKREEEKFEEKQDDEQQELDWKTDEEFKKFMGNPSIEAAIKLEKKRTDRKLKELDAESNSDNPIVGVFNKIARDNLLREKERLEKVEQAFKALDLNKLKSCFGFDSFFATDVRRFGDGGIFIGNLRKPIEEVMPKLEKKLSEAAGTDIVLWFMEEKKDDITKQIATRLTANRYGIKLSPSFLVPSNWTGCLGVMNNYESLLPNKKALFDIPVARTASAYLTSLALAVVAFVSDGSFNGGDNALFIRPQFFVNNPLFSFIQYVVGPYTDDLGNVLPYAVEGLGVPVDPLAFAGLLGMVVTSLNLLPCGRLEGGRIAQAMFGRNIATLLSFATSLLLGIGGLSGSVICLAWGLFATFFRGGEEIPAKDEITPLGDDRYAWGVVLFLICFLTLFPNGGGTFSSSFFSAPFFRGDL
ncbi:probable zinc metallopeptidase EGY3, chloroplastic isoform X2 [Beta vulgaris subsp. vulgaris]|uniref:probable zinc metallopeptidase EGY3, chloroplastic isoform X2 n=1 Tax=Beta vulgaris subsp. vulgaris TaxID=3555 RepID=UPI0020373384|nr:probable zinc metallopeptidase EGY3, chloroplastic isoform X2 [Beta vulgaris subsp. vulgaris]